MEAETMPSGSALQLLAVGGVCPDWSVWESALNGQKLGLAEAQWVRTPQDAITYLRKESWSLVLLDLSDPGMSVSKLVPIWEVLEQTGTQIPQIWIVKEWDQQQIEQCQEQTAQDDVEIQVSPQGWSCDSIAYRIGRFLGELSLRQELSLLQRERERYSDRDRLEAEWIMKQQQRMLKQIAEKTRLEVPSKISNSQSETVTLTPEQIQLKEEYERIFRQAIVFGAEESTADVQKLVSTIRSSGGGPGELLAAHIESVESFTAKAGEKSSRHIRQRADRLLLEVMIALAEAYRDDKKTSFPTEGRGAA